jgi:endonuclease G
MVKDKANHFLKIFITLCLVLLASCRTLCQNPQYDNLSFGVPGKADTIIDRPGYAFGYIEYHEQPAWVIYIMTKTEATTKVAKRTNKFRSDPEIPTGSATTGDYRRSGYDRGHLAPAADMAFSGQTMADSFFMSNMSPQKPAFNRGIWKDLEALVRYFAITDLRTYTPQSHR